MLIVCGGKAWVYWTLKRVCEERDAGARGRGNARGRVRFEDLVKDLEGWAECERKKIGG